MTAAATPTRTPRRALILALVIVPLAVGLAGGRAHTSSAAPTIAPIDASERPNPGALSTAWYCPGLPASFPTGDQTVTLSNLGPSGADAVITVQPDGGAAPIVRNVTVPPDTVRTFDRASLADGSLAPNGDQASPGSKPLPPGPIVVEPFSPDVVVEAGAETDDELDPVPCADTASTDWYFAAGTTVRGVAQWLVLDDPYSTDARVDVTLRTDTGLQQLPALQGIDVPGRSRVVVALQDQAVRQSARCRAGTRRRRTGRRIADVAVSQRVGPDRIGDLDRRAGSGKPMVVHRRRNRRGCFAMDRDQRPEPTRHAGRRAGNRRFENPRAARRAQRAHRRRELGTDRRLRACRATALPYRQTADSGWKSKPTTTRQSSRRH